MSSPVAATLTVPSPNPILSPPSGPRPWSQTIGTLEGLDHYLKDFQKYEAILGEMAKASADNKFGDELATIEQWFKVLSMPERTASVYTLLQHSTQDQIKFFMAVLQQMIKTEEKPLATDVASKSKNPKAGLRPPSLDIPLPGSSATPALASSTSQESPAAPLSDGSSGRLSLPKSLIQAPSSPFSQDNILRTPGLDKSWASMVNTPLVPMFQKPDASRSEAGSGVNGAGVLHAGNTSKGPGLAAISPATLNMLATSGLSNEAQLLAVQLVMSGILQPTDISTSQNQPPPPSAAKNNHKKASHAAWRAPSSAKYPGSALRSSVPKTGGMKSSGLKTSGLGTGGLDSAFLDSPRVEDFNPELLKDIPAWLRSLRLHKYTGCFDGMTWQEMVVLDDAMLEKKGIAALGARRRLLRTFDHVRKEMGTEDYSGATPTTSAIPPNDAPPPASDEPIVPHSAASTTKLSADSPVFMPTGKAPHSAASAVTEPSEVASAD